MTEQIDSRTNTPVPPHELTAFELEFVTGGNGAADVPERTSKDAALAAAKDCP